MLEIAEGIKIYIHLASIDMRKGINTLAVIVVEAFHENPQSGNVYFFFNKKRDKAKILFWDRNGFVLYGKRLEKHKYKMPKLSRQETLEITEVQLRGLLAGLDFMLMQQFSEINYHEFC